MAHETILVVDDEPAIVQVISERLRGEGYQVRTAGDGRTALAAVAGEGRQSPQQSEQGESRSASGAGGVGQPPDLLILDLMLPDMDGLDLLRSLRQDGSNVPVVVLTARDDDIDVIVGLELGADDYVIKPFNPRELAARVRAVLRRRTEALALAARVASLEALVPEATAPEAEPSGTHPHPPAVGLYFDPPARQAWFAGQLLDLRLREYDLLYFLARHQGQVVSRATLLDRVWGCDEFIDDRTVDVHVHRLRQKLAEIDPGADLIQTERGIGYRLVE
jgi:DNA-binding response OmpR family regulator